MSINSAEIFASDANFDKIALQIFEFQYNNNLVYKQFCDLLKKSPESVTSINEIPFLPISFFKTHQIITSKINNKLDILFTSSGTTGVVTSSHYVTDLNLYKESFTKGFNQFYGNPEDYTILALLPSYLEREGSSLVYMFDHLIKQSSNKNSGFYLFNLDELIDKIDFLESQNKKIVLIGVTYALLDLIEKRSFKLKNTIIMETGGMKGKRKELIREELHDILCKGFGVTKIHSEYGMTELLSQAYSKGDGIFECPPWMRVVIRDTEDSLSYIPNEKIGGINVIDLANINSCSFIATQDLGKKYDNDTFEVLGRFDNSDIRGCNLMVI